VNRPVTLIGSVLLIILATLLAYPRSRHAIRRSWHILRGELVDVGGHRLRIACGGTGSPTVVLESGLTFGRKTWDLVWPKVIKLTSVFSYDRAGLGESDRGPKPRTSLQIVRELHLALSGARIPPPYVLVGHSFGGLNVRLYASTYPKEVAGIVLINSSHEDQYALFASLLAPDERSAYLRHEGGENREGVDLLASAAEVRAAPSIPIVPVVVLSSERDDQGRSTSMASAEREIQSAVARWIPNSRHVIVENCGHFIQEERPELVVEAIRSVVEAARNSITSHVEK
jgi:pimeloyl-ACP methyl ester carboxylesterase